MEPTKPLADEPRPVDSAVEQAAVADAEPADPVGAASAPDDAGSARAVGCPFLISETGDWRLAAPAREHRCAAFVPATSLALDKQARLCLTAAHLGCATYTASLEAREARVGTAAVPARVGRWALAVTTPLIEDPGGLRARVMGVVSDRRTWPAVPAVILVVTLLALGFSGGGSGRPATALESPTPAVSPAPIATAAAVATPGPTAGLSPNPTIAATPVASLGPSPVPSHSTTYKVVSGDTLSGIATKFHTTVSAIKTLNGITDASRLRIGQVLLIP